MMKKIISIALAIAIVFLCFFGCYAYTLNYKYRPDYTELQDVILGHNKDTTSIGQCEKDYFTILDNCSYKCLNLFETTGLAFTTMNVQSIYFSPTKLIVSEKHPESFVSCNVFVKNDNAYLFVTYKEEDGRFSRSIFLIENNAFADELESDDSKPFYLLDAMLHDAFMFIIMQHGISIVTILVVVVVVIFLALKLRRKTVD